MRKIAYFCLIGLILLSLCQLLYQLPRLPDQVATHFDGAGRPDSFVSKTDHTLMMSCLFTLLPTFMVGIAIALRWIPDQLINIPNREFWLAPGRRQTTLRNVEVTLVWIAVATQLFLISLNHLTFQANRNQTGLNMPTFLFLMLVYLGAIGGICVYMWRKYRLPKDSTQNDKLSS